VGKILEGILNIIDQAIPDKDAAAKAKHDVTMKVLENEQNLIQGQIDINKIEAANVSIFVSGWRPFVGWICGLALFWQFMGYDLSVWVVSVAQFVNPAIKDFSVPKLVGSENLLEIVFAMLGLAGFRSFEKYKGVVK
jgi:hypothetical protein